MTMTIDDVKDPITVIFKQIVANKISAGDKGKALLLYKNADLTGTNRVTVYKSAVFTLEDATLEKYIKQMLLNCKQVTVLEYKTTVASVKDVIDGLKYEFDWIMSADSAIQSDIVSYAKENKKFAFTYNQNANSRFVASFNNPSAVYVEPDGTETTLTGCELIPYLGGWACGCPYNMAVDGKVFEELKSVAQPSTYTAGQLVLVPEEEGIRFGNECNTLTTLNSTQTEDMKSLAISEGMQRYELDLIKGYRQGYKGRYKNSYDNQCLYYAAVNNGYHKDLEQTGVEILDPNYDNKIYTDVETQRNAWLARGKSEAQDWSDEKVKQMTIGRNLYVKADVKFLAAMGPMQITVEMA